MKLLLTVFILLVLPAVGFCATIHVPADYPTIQEAIVAAVNGDTVLVAPGTYVENIDFLGKAISVKSEQGVAETIIDGNQWAGSVVTFQSGEGLDSVLEGFTLTNGLNSDGGGIRCILSSSPTITNNKIIGNWAAGGEDGGGIYCGSSSSPSIIHNIIANNWVWEGHGAGICCDQSSPSIANNTIIENIGWSFAYGEVYGAGISCYNNSSPKIVDNIIAENRAYVSGLVQSFGGGIFCERSSPIIINNTISGNSATYGGGICFLFSSSPVVTNNVITGNNSWGGGMYCDLNSFPIVTNTVLWDNQTPEIVGSPIVTYCNIKGGYPGTGNIDADPLFVEPGYWDDNGTPGNPSDDFWVDGDYHLTFNSPCRGSGNNAAPGLPETDFEGDPRIYQGTVDMGADEFCTHLYCTGDSTPGGDIEGKLVGLPGTFPVGLFFGSGELDQPMHTAWGEFCLLPPWYLVQLAPIPSNGILVLPATLPSSPPAPYDIYMQALIGLDPDSLSNLCVLEVR